MPPPTSRLQPAACRLPPVPALLSIYRVVLYCYRTSTPTTRKRSLPACLALRCARRAAARVVRSPDRSKDALGPRDVHRSLFTLPQLTLCERGISAIAACCGVRRCRAFDTRSFRTRTAYGAGHRIAARAPDPREHTSVRLHHVDTVRGQSSTCRPAAAMVTVQVPARDASSAIDRRGGDSSRRLPTSRRCGALVVSPVLRTTSCCAPPRAAPHSCCAHSLHALTTEWSRTPQGRCTAACVAIGPSPQQAAAGVQAMAHSCRLCWMACAFLPRPM